MESITWVPLKNYEGYYEINGNGEVKSLHSKNVSNILPQRIDRAGYYTVHLCHQKTNTSASIHRLLAIAFIPNPEGKKYVNHKDGNKLNNKLTNLEWCTHSENIKHAYDIGLIKKQMHSCMQVVDTCTKKVYRSVSEAARALGIPYSTCKSYLNGNRNNPTCLEYAA